MNTICFYFRYKNITYFFIKTIFLIDIFYEVIDNTLSINKKGLSSRISPSISWVLDYYIISDYNLLYILN